MQLEGVTLMTINVIGLLYQTKKQCHIHERVKSRAEDLILKPWECNEIFFFLNKTWQWAMTDSYKCEILQLILDQNWLNNSRLKNQDVNILLDVFQPPMARPK